MSESLLIRDLPQHERPRERLVLRGADALRVAELIAILLRTGTKGSPAVSIAEQLLKTFETLDNLARATPEDLCKIRGIARDKAITLQRASTMAGRMAELL